MKDNQNQENQINVFLLTIITLLSVSFNAENTIYMEYFPKLIHYYNINLDETGYILRVSFVGSFITSFFVGPLAECYGRKKLFIGGVVLYIFSSLACFLSKSFEMFLFWRFVEGIARAIPVVVGWLMVFDQHSIAKSGKQISFVQGAASLVAISVPIFSLNIGQIIGWHDVLLLSSILSFICLIMIATSVKETLPLERRKKLNFREILGNYLKLLKSPDFMAYSLIYAFSSINYSVFFSNASIIFVDHLGLSKEAFGYYQTINTTIFIIFSFLGVKLIAHKGIDYSKNLGFIIFIAGCVTTFVTSLINDINIEAIFIAIMITAAGGALMNGFMLKAVNIFPEMKGTAMTFCSGLSLLLSARGSFWAQKFFNDTILPAVTVIFICSMISLSIFIWLKVREKEA